jgi:hypothetical protein
MPIYKFCFTTFPCTRVPWVHVSGLPELELATVNTAATVSVRCAFCVSLIRLVVVFATSSLLALYLTDMPLTCRLYACCFVVLQFVSSAGILRLGFCSPACYHACLPGSSHISTLLTLTHHFCCLFALL